MKHSLFFCLLIFVSPRAASGQDGCILKVFRDSIKVYTCPLKDSKYRAVKSVFLVKSTLSQFAAMVLDIDHYDEWQYKTLSAKVLEKKSDQEMIYYTEIESPVVTNRDFVIGMTFNQDPSTKELIIDLVSLPDYIPPKKTAVRVPFSRARWRAKALTPSVLQIDYYIEIDIGGDVPVWLVNMVAPQAPYETFKNLRTKIGNYENAKVPFILE